MEQREKHHKLSLENNKILQTKIGILADLPGYGKSFSVLGLIARSEMPWNLNDSINVFESVTSNNSATFISSVYASYPRVKASLIVAPLSTLHQWVEYLQMTTLTYYVVDTKKTTQNVDANAFDVILVSPTFYNDFVGQFESVAFNRFVYDEPVHNVIPAMKFVQAGYYWMMCANWTALKYTYSHGSRGKHMLRSMFEYPLTDYLQHLVIKNPDEYVRESFVMPTTHSHTYRCIQPNVYHAISSYVSSDVLNMISAGNIKGAVEHLGGRQTNGNLIQIVIEKQQTKLSDARLMKQMYKARIDVATKQGKIVDKSMIDSKDMWTKKVQEFETNIEEIKKKYEQILQEDCVVCADTLQSPVMVPCCQHIFCGNCVMDWVRKKGTCITCRSPLTLNMLIYVNESGEEIKRAEREEREKPKTKQEMIVSVIQSITTNNPDAKIIVFSEYDETFTMIKQVLSSSNLTFKECKGNVKTREKVLRNFRIGNVPILFLNAQYNGAGINLQETTDIILYHEMAETVRMQIVGRANRLGRQYELHVHTLTS